tara:strand:- start:350 stop:745 length:396 start_codon:yes stop_codon:yes gene_type:complete
MKYVTLFILLFPILAFSQTENNLSSLRQVTIEKNYHQGVLDGKMYFNGTRDYFIGFVSLPAYYIPAGISYVFEPKDNRFLRNANPNLEYLYTDVDYYNGFKHGATKKKKRRLIQGALTSTSLFIMLAFLSF